MKNENWRNKGILLAMLIGVLMASLDNTIVSTAMPTIISNLGGFEIFSWVLSAYLLTSTALMPVFGKLSDAFGKKKIYLIGLTIFILGSMLCSISNSMIELIIYRSIQGIGAAILFPITYAMIADIFPLEERGKMEGILAAVFGISSVTGPLLGAIFTQYLSWHWIFLINIPLGLIGIALISSLYHEKKDLNKVDIDYGGAITLCLALTTTIFSFSFLERSNKFFSPQVMGLFFLALILFLMFLFFEKRAKEPIVPFSIFSGKVISAISISFLTGVIIIAASSYIPLFVQGILERTAITTGYIVIPMMLSLVVSAAISGFLMTHFSFRSIMIVAALFISTGTFLLSNLEIQTSFNYILVSMIFLGLGLGPLMPIPMIITQISVPKNFVSVSSSLVEFFRNIGMIIGISFSSIFINKYLNAKIINNEKLENTLSSEILQPQVLFSPSFKSENNHEIISLLKEAFCTGVSNIFFICTLIAILCLIFSFTIGNSRLLGNNQQKSSSNSIG
jgi:EmrB/QacA subfamily drug resistance transporter